MKKNILELFIDKLLAFPLWVKQIIYLRLYQNLAKNLSEDFISMEEGNLFHLHVPVLSFKGKTELTERHGGYEENVYIFLADIDNGLNMLESSMNNFWTMEEVARYYIFCLGHDLLKRLDVVYINAIAGFMSGQLRTGEYFKHINKINVDQLEEIIYKQKEYEKQGTPKKMAELMIELGFITEKDVHSLLILKEEAQKRFMLDASIIPTAAKEAPITPSSGNQVLEAQIQTLTAQNTQLKDQLKKLLAFVKKNG